MKKPWYKKWWIWAIVAGVLVIGGIGNAVGGGGEPVETPVAVEPAETEAPEVPEPEPEPEEPTATPADAEAMWLEMHGVEKPLDFMTTPGYSSTLDNPLYAIQPGWEGSTSGYLEVRVQENLSDEAVMNLGRNILNFIGPDFPDIAGVVFTDASGLDHNFYRRDAPLADR